MEFQKRKHAIETGRGWLKGVSWLLVTKFRRCYSETRPPVSRIYFLASKVSSTGREEPMSKKIDLYSSSYSNYSLETYSEVRLETYGEDYGQTGWVSTEESHEIPELLQLTSDSSVLDIGC